MRNLVSLIKLQINSQYGLSYARYVIKNDKKAFSKGLGIGLIILIAIGEVVGLYLFLMHQLYKTATAINTPQLILTMASIVSGLFILVFGIFYILGALFLAKDTEFLASLPIKQGSVFVSKFLLVLLGEYPFAFFLMLPPVIIYGRGTNQGILYYLLAIICTLLLPLLPLVISAVLALLLMNIVARSRRRDLITVIGSIILMIVVIGGQNYLISRIPENQEEFLITILQSSNAFIEFMGRAFPPAIWITKVLALSGWGSFVNLLYLLLSSVVFFGVVYFLASFIYQKGANAQLETRSSNKKRKLSYAGSSHVMAIFKNEWKILLRTPIFALNSLIVIIIAPIMMALPMFGGSLANDPDLQFIYNLIQNDQSATALVLIVAGIITAFSLINPAISTTLSREGKNIWILKNIPVEPKTQILGKFLAGYSISFTAAILGAAAAMLAFKIPLKLVVMIAFLSSIALVPISAISLLIDLMRPKLSWNNPQEAIKQNLNAVFGMLLGFVFISVCGLISYFLTKTELNVYWVFGIMSLLLLVASYVSAKILYKYTEKAFLRIEA